MTDGLVAIVDWTKQNLSLLIDRCVHKHNGYIAEAMRSNPASQVAKADGEYTEKYFSRSKPSHLTIKFLISRLIKYLKTRKMIKYWKLFIRPEARMGQSSDNETPNAETTCEDCVVLLREVIAREYPQIRNEKINDWGKIKLLRQWTHEHVWLGTESTQLGLGSSWREFYSKDAPALFSMFFQYRGATMCKGYAYALMKLYQMYGFESYIFGFGNRQVMTHAVTLVRIKHKERIILAIQDATFDITYIDSNGIPFDFFDLLKTLKSHNHHMVMIEHGNAGAPYFIFDLKDKIEEFYGLVIKPDDKPISELPNGRLIYKSKETIDTFNDRYGPSVGEMLEKEGHPSDMIYLFLYLLYMQDGKLNSVDDLLKQAEAIIG